MFLQKGEEFVKNGSGSKSQSPKASKITTNTVKQVKQQQDSRQVLLSYLLMDEFVFPYFVLIVSIQCYNIGSTFAMQGHCHEILLNFCQFFLFSSLPSSHILGTILFIHQFLFFCNCSVHAGLSELNCHGDFVAIKEIAALFCSYL